MEYVWKRVGKLELKDDCMVSNLDGKMESGSNEENKKT